MDTAAMHIHVVVNYRLSLHVSFKSVRDNSSWYFASDLNYVSDFQNYFCTAGIRCFNMHHQVIFSSTELNKSTSSQIDLNIKRFTQHLFKYIAIRSRT